MKDHTTALWQPVGKPPVTEHPGTFRQDKEYHHDEDSDYSAGGLGVHPVSSAGNSSRLLLLFVNEFLGWEKYIDEENRGKFGKFIKMNLLRECTNGKRCSPA